MFINDDKSTIKMYFKEAIDKIMTAAANKIPTSCNKSKPYNRPSSPQEESVSNEHATFPEIPVSHDATTYMDHLHLHKKIQHEGKTGYAWSHASPEENGRNNDTEVQFTLMIPVEGGNNRKMMMEERLHQCYSMNPAWGTSVNKMKKRNMQITNNIQRSQDVEENIAAMMNQEEDNQVNMNETLVLLGGGNPKDHKFISMKVVTMLTRVAENDTDVNEMKNNNVSIRRR